MLNDRVWISWLHCHVLLWQQLKWPWMKWRTQRTAVVETTIYRRRRSNTHEWCRVQKVNSVYRFMEWQVLKWSNNYLLLVSVKFLLPVQEDLSNDNYISTHTICGKSDDTLSVWYFSLILSLNCVIYIINIGCPHDGIMYWYEVIASCKTHTKHILFKKCTYIFFNPRFWGKLLIFLWRSFFFFTRSR